MARQHGVGHEVSAAQLVDESVALRVDNDGTLAPQCLSSECLDFVIRSFGVDQSSGVHLNLFDVAKAAADFDRHFDSVAGAVAAVGGCELLQVWSVLVEQRVFSVVCSVAAGADDDGAVLGVFLAFDVFLLAPDDNAILLQQFKDGGLVDNGAFLLVDFLNLFQSLQKSHGDRHAGEEFLSAVGTFGTVASQLGHEAEVDLERVFQPLDGVPGLEGQNAAEFVLFAFLA